jgi:type II secretory pathway pseudopilin PulG
MRRTQNHPDLVHGRAPARSRGFTLIELLVVIAVVIILIGILLVALQAATRASQRANTGALLQAIQKGMIEFKDVVGYLPPVLGPEDLSPGAVADLDEFRSYRPPPSATDDLSVTQDEYADAIQDWYSYTSIAEYLIGYGPEDEDGADRAGLRSPQADGYWGVASSVGDLAECAGTGPGTLAARRCFLGQSSLSTSLRNGKIFGPFLELRDERLLGAINGVDDQDEPIIVFPGEAGYNDALPKVVVDYWGKPIRYFRTLYRQGSLNLPYRGFEIDPNSGQQVPMKDPPTLADVFILRPWEVPVGAGATSVYQDAVGDTTTSNELKHAQFALFSSGQDRQLHDDVRRDTQPDPGPFSGGFNEDNLIEVAK